MAGGSEFNHQFMQNMVNNYAQAGTFTTSVTSEIGGVVTNLSNIAGTWGKFIPTGWGNYRIAGYQVWSSAFYKITDSVTIKLTDNYAKLTEAWKNATGTTNGMLYGDRTTTNISERIGVDAAYSFGYNGLGGAVKIAKIRFNQNIIYDNTNPDAESDYAFTVRYGTEDYPEPIMVARATDPENVVYYPGQIVVTFAGLVNGNGIGASDNTSPLPTSVDIEIQSGSQVGVEVGQRTSFPNSTFASTSSFDSSHNFWNGDFFYLYNTYDSPKGSIEKWRLSDMTFINKVPITIDYGPGQNNAKLTKLVTARGFKMMVGQLQGPGAFGAIYVIDPDTGNAVFTYGVNGWPNFEPFGSGFPYIQFITVLEDTETTFTIAGTNDASPNLLILTITKGNGYSAVISEVSRNGLYYLPDSIMRGDDGRAIAKYGNKLYAFSKSGVSEILEDSRFNLTIHDFVPIGNKTFVAFDNTYSLFDADGKVIYTKTPNDEAPTNAFGWSNRNSTRRQISGRKPGSNLYVTDWVGQYTLIIEMETGKATWTRVVSDNPNISRPAGGTYYDPLNGKFYAPNFSDGTGNGFVQLAYTSYGERILLRDFLRSLYVNTGKYTADQIEFVDIDDTIVGALLVKAYPLESIVNNTCTLYQIERLETRNSIKFYRNAPIIGEADIQYDLDIDDLALQSDSGDERASLVTTVSDSQKTVAEIKLTFIDYTADYNENSVSWRRPDAPADATTTQSISTIIIMDKNEALSLVQIKLQDKVTSQTQHKLRLPPSYSDVYKGDILRITHKGFTSVMKVTETSLNADHSVSILADGASLSRRVLPTIPDVANVNVDTALGKGNTVVVPLDISPIHPSHSFEGEFPYYYLAYGEDPAWAGGYITRSNNKEAEGRLFEVAPSAEFAAFKTLDALTDKKWVIDTDVLSVELVSNRWNAADNTTVEELVKNKAKNLAIYGAPGRWEIMQIASVVDGKATGILRGLRGTDAYTSLHVPGDMLFLIKTFVIMERRALDNVGIEDTLKAVSYWQKFANANSQKETVKAVSLKPFSPHYVRASKAEDGTKTVTWLRRDRLAGNSFAGVPMSEVTKTYELDIIKNNAVIRTVEDLTNESFAYTSEMQQADGTSTDNTLTVEVFQISAVVGRGYGRRVSLNV